MNDEFIGSIIAGIIGIGIFGFFLSDCKGCSCSNNENPETTEIIATETVEEEVEEVRLPKFYVTDHTELKLTFNFKNGISYSGPLECTYEKPSLINPGTTKKETLYGSYTDFRNVSIGAIVIEVSDGPRLLFENGFFSDGGLYLMRNGYLYTTWEDCKAEHPHRRLKLMAE